MKAFSVSRRLLSVISLLLAIMMLFAACGPDENVSQTSDPDDAQVSSEDSADESTDESQDDTQNDDGNNSAASNQQNSNPGNKPSAVVKNDAFNKANASTYYKQAPKGQIHVLMWKKWDKTEESVVKQYEKLTGNKVKVTLIAEKDYANKLVTMVTGKNSPDVVCLQANYFPGLVTRALQPLDPKVFQLDSDCWATDIMDAFKVNGRYFSVAMPRSWSCEDLNYVTYYNPQLLKSVGITTMPYDLWRQGKWNWETQGEIIRKAKAAGKTGLEVQNTDVYMHSAGQDFVSYDGKQFKNLLSDTKKINPLLVSAWAELAQFYADKAVGGWNITDTSTGKCALTTSIAYGLYSNTDWYNASAAKQINAVPVAGPKGKTAYTPVRPKTWGVPKNAKNPKGAAYFLRYFLDVSTYNFDSTFYHNNFKEVFNTVTKSGAKKSIMYGWGVSDYVTAGTYNIITGALVSAQPQNITSILDQASGTLNSPVERANKALKQVK